MKLYYGLAGVAYVALMSVSVKAEVADPTAPPPSPPATAEEAPPLYGPAPKAGIEDPKDKVARKANRNSRQLNYNTCMGKISVAGSMPLLSGLYKLKGAQAQAQVQPRVALSACDTLLALPPNNDYPWDDRARLLQARAAHLIGLEAHDVALEMLAESDALGAAKSDGLFQSGVGVGNMMLRAYALGQQGKKEEALAEVARGRDIRKHATAIDRTFSRIEHNLHNDIDRMLDDNAAKIKWQPNLMRFLLPLYVWRGRLESATPIVDEVSTVDPKPVGGWTLSGTVSASKQLSDDVDLQMLRAYVWATLGNVDKAQSIIVGARNDIAEFVGQRPAIVQGKKPNKSAVRDYENRVIEGTSVSALITRWEAAIKLRSETQAKSAEELFSQAEGLDILGLSAGLDILRNLKFENPKDEADLAKAIAKYDTEIANSILKLSIADLWPLVPEAEYLNEVPKFGGAGDGIIFGRENGFSQAKEKDSDIRTIRFGTTSGSGPMAEELALVAAAQYAQKEGKDSFILLARRVIKRTTTVSGYYVSTYTLDSGYESQVRVVLLDSNNLPAEWADKSSRLISVKQVLEDIQPRYDRLMALKNGDKAKKN
jgi:tetratricopeptide (TPR) repeat protein